MDTATAVASVSAVADGSVASTTSVVRRQSTKKKAVAPRKVCGREVSLAAGQCAYGR